MQVCCARIPARRRFTESTHRFSRPRSATATRPHSSRAFRRARVVSEKPLGARCFWCPRVVFGVQTRCWGGLSHWDGARSVDLYGTCLPRFKKALNVVSRRDGTLPRTTLVSTRIGIEDHRNFIVWRYVCHDRTANGRKRGTSASCTDRRGRRPRSR